MKNEEWKVKNAVMFLTWRTQAQDLFFREGLLNSHYFQVVERDWLPDFKNVLNDFAWATSPLLGDLGVKLSLSSTKAQRWMICPCPYGRSLFSPVIRFCETLCFRNPGIYKWRVMVWLSPTNKKRRGNYILRTHQLINLSTHQPINSSTYQLLNCVSARQYF